MSGFVIDEGLRLSGLAEFGEIFGGSPAVASHAPGRVNLIGEHTDYTQGWVLPAALHMGTTVLAGRRSDRVLHVCSKRLGREDRASLDHLDAPGEEWMRYVRGMASVLQNRGVNLRGADLLIDGDLPLRAGLSSSASLEMSVGLALLALSGDELEPSQLAAAGRQAENETVGVQSGLMDQLAVACGKEGHALLIDCRTSDIEPVPVPDAVSIVVLDTGVRRELAGSEYNTRRAECESALRKLQAVDPSLDNLRDVTIELLATHDDRLDDVELRRARHVVTENARVVEGAEALRDGAVERFGELMRASHASLRDDFEVSGPELDRMVGIADSAPGVLGARLTGGGFGGCAVALVEAASAESSAATIVETYRRQTGGDGRWYVCHPAGPASAVSLDGRHAASQWQAAE